MSKIDTEVRPEPYLLLKWGTLKGWGNIPEKNHALMEQFLEGASMSAAGDKPDDRRKQILIGLINAHEGDIQNDWDGKHYTQAEAVEYILNYGKKTPLAAPPAPKEKA